MPGQSRSQRKMRCEKPGQCLGREGEPLSLCNDAPGYLDYALPASEHACIRSISDHEFAMQDPFKEQYAIISHQVDGTLADPNVGADPENLEIRFDSFRRGLTDLIESPELDKGDKGRYLYHIEARVLEAYLEAFHYRALHGLNEPIPQDLISSTRKAMVNILDDFDGLYKDIVAQVALKRTEIEIPTLLLRTGDSNYFTWPTLFREDASQTRMFNHDGYPLYEGEKIPIQIKNTGYRTKGPVKMSDGYDEGTVLVIHQDVVNLDFTDGETHVTVVKPRDITPLMDEDNPYDIYDEMPRFVAWGAGEVGEPDEEFATEYIQKIGGYKRDGLVDALVREANGEKLSIEELNMLNGASHYLVASIREKR